MIKYSAEQYSILRYIMSQHRTGHSRVIITAEHRAVQSTADSIEVQRDAVDMMQDSAIKISAISTIVDSTVQDIHSSTAHSATVRRSVEQQLWTSLTPHRSQLYNKVA
jgi:hypothetical protein